MTQLTFSVPACTHGIPCSSYTFKLAGVLDNSFLPGVDPFLRFWSGLPSVLAPAIRIRGIGP